MEKYLKLKIVFLLIVSIISNSSCVFDRDDHKLKLYNDTNKEIYFILKKDTLLQLKDVKFIEEESRFNTVKVKDTCLPLFARINAGGYIRKINEECMDSTMFLYLFEIDSVKKYGWASNIKKESMFIKKGFKVKDLDNINWIIKLRELMPDR